MRTDAKHHGHNPGSHHGTHAGLDMDAVHHNPEALAPPWSNEDIHGDGPHWETLWIDLGGEG
jgi:hypothetical protein